MGEKDWSSRDLTGIKPRRPESAGEFVDDWVDQTRLSIMWPQLGDAGVHSKCLQQGGSQFDVGTNVPVKMDTAATTTTNRVQSSDGLEEFEFSMSVVSSERVCPSVMSSADELFFKGKLLPLHLTPRLRMVQKLASQKQQLESDTNKNPPAQTPQPRVPGPSFHPKYSKFWTHNAELLSSSDCSAPDSGFARFRGHTNWSDPRDRDSLTDSCRDSTSARDSSSSRDSNGSSQDANFSDSTCKDFQMPTTTSNDLKSGFLHNREVFGTHVRSHAEGKSAVCSSFKLPFKWKVLFGAKKVAARSSASVLDHKAGQQMHRLPNVSEESVSVDTVDAVCGVDALCDNHVSDDRGELSLRSGYTESSSRGFEQAIDSADAERDQSGMAKAREYLQKYMKILKPVHMKKFEHHNLGEQSCRAVNFSLPSSSLAHESRRQSRNVPGNRSFSSFSQTARLASIDFQPRSQSSLGTPARRGIGRPVGSGSTSELHSAIQGAIAHCKESQSTAKKERASGSQRFASSIALS